MKDEKFKMKNRVIARIPSRKLSGSGDEAISV